jgi:pyrimidine-nucleoside phosphorylase
MSCGFGSTGYHVIAKFERSDAFDGHWLRREIVELIRGSEMEGFNSAVKKMIDDFAKHRDPATMDALIAQFRDPDLPDEFIAHLAMRLAESGEILSHSRSDRTADVPSTGGPSSLSTLLCPLQLVAAGAKVPKLGVPGRPAGGIDVLACIPEFNPTLDLSQVLSCLDGCGYAHFLAGQRFAPLDALLFSYRQKVGAQDVATLAIASLLSKKLAVGVHHVTLDIRVAPFTNFGDWDNARTNGRRFISVARHLGISASCLLTDCCVPYQGHIGRGESLLALKSFFDGYATQDILSHVSLCQRMAEDCLGGAIDISAAGLAAIFRRHLEQQGTTWAKFEQKTQDVLSQPKRAIQAKTDGYLAIDLDSIRRVLTVYQSNMTTTDVPFPDPCGIVLTISCDSAVRRGDVVAEVRANDNLDVIAAELDKHIHQSEQPPLRRAPEPIR